MGKLQHHFGTRDELVRQAFEHHLLSITRHLEALRNAGGSATKRMSMLVDEIIENRSWQRSTLWIDLLSRSIDSAEYRSSAREIYQAWRTVFSELIQDGLQTGEFTVSTTAEDAAASIVAMADGLTILVITSGEEQLDREQEHRRALLATVINSAVGAQV